MAGFIASDITYTIIKERRDPGQGSKNIVKLEFGDSAITYTAGGIPLTKGKMGCPVIVDSLIVVDKGVSGYSFKYDQSAEKLIVFRTGSENAVDEQASTVAIAAQAITVEVRGH